MADCSKEFLELNNSISLTKTDRKLLRAARMGVTKKIATYFKSNSQCPKVEFKGQGSFSMGTIIKPLNGEFDIDIGVYLRGYTNWQDSWPKPETASQWLLNALSNHTSLPPINKRTCIRIMYKPLAGNKDVAYHVDLPIYCEYQNLFGETKTRIGINGDTQWSQKSDPMGFTKWFFDKCKQNRSDKDQLIRLVKYIKAWKESKKGKAKFPSGMALTILLANNYKPYGRDDLAFKETIRYSYNDLYGLLSSDIIHSPVEPYNDVLSRLSDNQKEYFKECFEKLVNDAINAVDEPDKRKAMSIWGSQFNNNLMITTYTRMQ